MESARERAVVASSLLALSAAFAAWAAPLNTTLSGTVGKVSWTLTVPAVAVLALVAAVLGAFGAHATVCAHPRAQAGQLSHTAHYWPPAAVLSAVAIVVASRATGPWLRLGGTLAFGILAAVVLLLAYHTVDAGAPVYRRARWALSILDYAIALGAFAAIAAGYLPLRWSALLCAAAAALLAADLLRQPERTPDSAAAYVALAGFILGLAAHRVLLWAIAPIKAALLLLLLFYVLTGAIEHHLRSRLTWWTRVEYLVVLVLGTWALLKLVP